MHNEELLAAIDASPTYKRTAQQLELMTAMAAEQENTPAASTEQAAESTVQEEENCENIKEE